MTLLTDLLLVIGFVVIFLVLLMLLNARQKGLSLRLLAGFFVAAFVLNLDYYSVLHNLRTLELIIFPATSGLEFALGPLILFYVRSVFDPKIRIRNLLVHLIPFFVFELLFYLPYLVSVLRKEYLFNYLQILENELFRYYVSMLFIVIYTIRSYWELVHYQSAAKDNCSNLNISDLIWIKRLIIGTLVVLILDMLQEFSLSIWLDLKTIPFFDNGYITAFSVIVLVTYLGYYGIRRSKVLIPTYLFENLSPNEKKTVEGNVFLDKDELSLMKKGLSRAFEDEKLYLDEDLTLSTLALNLSLNSKKISWFLNHHLQTNFHDYVNKYRVKEFIERIKSGNYKEYTLLAIAFDSGFKSKTSFNRIFKNEMGLTPSEFKKQQQKK